MGASTAEIRRDAEVIGLVGFAHLFSHFLQLILAPLFPLLKDEFGVGYAAFGLMVSVMYTVSGMSQTMAGFIVDRYGARRRGRRERCGAGAESTVLAAPVRWAQLSIW